MARFKNTNYEIIYVFIDNIHRPTKILIIPQLFHVIPPTLSRFKAQKHPWHFTNYLSHERACHPFITLLLSWWRKRWNCFREKRLFLLFSLAVSSSTKASHLPRNRDNPISRAILRNRGTKWVNIFSLSLSLYFFSRLATDVPFPRRIGTHSR